MKKESTKEPLRGEKLAKMAANQIINNPNTYNQCRWHSGDVVNGCHTVHCFGGWVQVLAGRPENAHAIIGDVRELLGISNAEAYWICAGDRTFYDIYKFIQRFSNAGFDRAGFDRAGFDRDGRDRAGFDRDGRDRDGNKLTPFEI